MTRPVQRAEKNRNLAVPCQPQLNSYAIAAAAAGVTILALAAQSEAKIVYTPTHRVIGDGSSYRLDFTGNGRTDLTIQNKHFSSCTDYGNCSSWQSLGVNLSASNQVVYNVFGAVAMKPGMRIGPKDGFAGGLQHMAVGNGSFFGSWINVKNRYLGVKIKIKGKVHYGWARLSVQVQRPITITATLTGYAYETVANKPIVAGKTKDDADIPSAGSDSAGLADSAGALVTRQSPHNTEPVLPGSLGWLARGTVGAPFWRRKNLPIAGPDSR